MLILNTIYLVRIYFLFHEDICWWYLIISFNDNHDEYENILDYLNFIFMVGRTKAQDHQGKLRDFTIPCNVSLESVSGLDHHALRVLSGYALDVINVGTLKRPLLDTVKGNERIDAKW